ncbi:S-adenosyl-L-methionine-dependent methyltransferase [Scenedesmus sp. NREL 46B-D3]|nr:S-adenosyl-L-methionine-dependent methyltransferase [Scenedesmus sp. NREL 46B-D3]
MRGARVLMLDDSGNVHSLYREGQVLTGAYWDCLALLPAVAPAGPLAILGLGAGTIAQLVHALYPERVMHGWELDPAVVGLAQQHMGLQPLTDRGCLVAHVGDALADSAAVDPPGAAGIFVDLFSEGQLIPELTQAVSWGSIRQRLAPGGRVITNLGAAPMAGMLGRLDPAVATTRQALAAMAQAFEGQLSCCSFVSGSTANMMVITGPPISSQDWAAAPEQLRHLTKNSWEPWRALQG